MHPGHSPLPRLGRPASPSACREFFRTKLDKVARNPLRCRLDTSAPLRLLLLRLLQRSALPYSILHPPLEFGECLSPGITLAHEPGAGRRTVGRILANAVAVAGVRMPRNVSTKDESRGGGRRKPRG